jgi:hypothetical protein
VSLGRKVDFQNDKVHFIYLKFASFIPSKRKFLTNHILCCDKTNPTAQELSYGDQIQL